MPIYTWKCECDQLTEVIRPMVDYEQPPEKCDHCGSTTFKHSVIIRPDNCKGVILLGDSGWHHTDYTRNRCIK